MKTKKRFNIRYLFWKRCLSCGWWNSKKDKLCNNCDINLLVFLFAFIPFFGLSQKVDNINQVAIENVGNINEVNISNIGSINGVSKPSGSADGYYVAFDGTSKIELDASSTIFDISIPGAVNATFGCWIRFTEGNQGYFMAKYIITNDYYLRGYASLVGHRFWFDDGELENSADSDNGAIDDGLWYHVVGVIDGSVPEAKLYVNGVLEETVNLEGYNIIGNNVYNFTIGGGGFGTTVCDIDEPFFAWAKATLTDVENVMGTGPEDSKKGDPSIVFVENLEFWYDFSEGTGTTVADYTKNWDDSFGGTCSFQGH